MPFTNARETDVSIRWGDGPVDNFTHDFDSFAGLNEKMTGSAARPGLPAEALKGVRL